MITGTSKTMIWYPLLCHRLIIDKEPWFVQFRYNWPMISLPPSTLSQIIIRCVDIMKRSAYGFTQMTRTQWTEQKGILQWIFVVHNKRQTKPKGQTRMYNAPLGTQDTWHKTQNDDQQWLHPQNRERSQVLAKGKQFLSFIRHPPCYSYSQDVLDTTLRKQAQIT